MSTPEWLTPTEVAEVQRLHPNTIRERVHEGLYPANKVQRSPGGRIRIHRSVVYPETPATITHLPAPGITDAQLDAALDRAIVRLIDRLLGADARLRRIG
jgi:hypothetical protein